MFLMERFWILVHIFLEHVQLIKDSFAYLYFVDMRCALERISAF
jgi:hypothetical protein